MNTQRREWYSSTMRKELAEKFKLYLKEHGVYYEPSEDGKLIHFELYINEKEAKKVNTWISRSLNIM